LIKISRTDPLSNSGSWSVP